MYGRQSNTPTWFIIVVAVTLVFGGYFVWRGLLAWADANFSYTAPTASSQDGSDGPTLPFSSRNLSKTIPPTASPTQVCIQFRVKVLRARVRECPKDTCNTITLPEQGAVFCVLGAAPEATDWYRVNLKPDDPLGEIGYMSSSVLSAVNPTPKPSATLNLATVTQVPTTTTPTFTPSLPPHRSPIRRIQP